MAESVQMIGEVILIGEVIDVITTLYTQNL